MADGTKFEVTGEFVDHISDKLKQITSGFGDLGAALGSGLAIGSGIAIFEKLSEVIKDLIVELPKLTLEAIKVADEFGKMSQRTGIATEELQGLAYAAMLADVPIEGMTKTINKLNKQIEEAGSDSESKAGAIFKALGVNARDAAGKLVSAESAISQIADKFSKMADGPNKVALAMELGGRGLVKAIPLLNQGAESYKKLADEAKGIELFNFSDTQTRQSEEFNDSMKIIGQTFKGIGAVIAKELLPFISEMAKYFSEGAKEGGTLNLVIQTLGKSFAFLLEFLIPLIIGFATITALIKATAQGIAGLAASAYQLAHGDLEGAKNTLDEMSNDIKKTYTDLADFIEKTNNPDRSTNKKASLGPEGPSLTKITEGIKLTQEYEKAVSELTGKLYAANKAGEMWAVTIETQTGKYKKFSPEQKAHLIDLAKQIDIATSLTKITKELTDVEDARNKKIQSTMITNQANMIADSTARAGYIEAETRRLEIEDKLNKQAEEAKNLAPAARAEIMKRIDAERAAAQAGTESYEAARKQGEALAIVTAQSKVWSETINKNRDALKELTVAQGEYNKMLDQGAISQDEFAKLTLENKRAQEDLTNSQTIAGKAYSDVILSNRRSMEDVVMKMAAIRDANDQGKLSTAEYTKAMYDLQQSYDNLNPTFAINQLEKMQGIMKQTAAGFENMFSDAIFNAMQGKWTNLGDMIKQQIDRMVANMLAAQIQIALFGDLGSTPAGKTPSSTGLLGGIFSTVFGGARADGGPVDAGKSYLVGERRPEVFVPSSSGNILSSVGDASSNMGGTSITINAMDSQDVMRVLSKSKRDIANMVTQTNRAYNLKGA